MTDDEIALFDRLVDLAAQHNDGHLTIMKFTTNWRVAFFTPDRFQIDDMPVAPTFADACRAALEAVEPLEFTNATRSR